ncbi:TNT domain-containing protein [Qaidamihabitans albus]|uniref:TNT domain-containing protein n=1 Tax=Qaidamihabitans albus TaxID=2795733 RepID=UPI0018F1F1E0|nr:TNT domain-containing protein [Qaidamihabitans albus]
MCRALKPSISQDVLVAQPTQLNATEQDTLVKQIGLALLRAAPRDWRRVIAEYRAVGRYHELTGEIVTADGSTQEWVATHDIATLFGRLRAGMYREGRGTWFNARYQLDHPSSYNLEYDREEPRWDLMPPPQAYADELRMFPRSEDNVPDWLMRRMSGLGPERPGPRFRMARIFDGAGPNGRPVINRPELDAEEQDRLLDYLDGAPVVLPGRGYDLDRLASTTESTVPIAFHSDGVWIWPAAVNYYLREYGVAPEPDLVQHIRAAGFSIPDVPEPVRQAASAHITRGGPPQQRPGPPAMAEPEPPPEEPQAREEEPPFEEEFAQTDAELTQFAAPPQYDEPYPGELEDAGEHTDVEDTGPVEQATTYTPVPDLAGGPPTTITSPPPPPVTQHAVQDPPAGDEEPDEPPVAEQETDQRPIPGRDQLDLDESSPPTPPTPPTQYSPGPHSPGPPPAPDEPVLDRLEDRLAELGVPESAYRIGEPADRGWSIEEVAEGWRVGWYDGELTSTAVFGDAEDAAAFMLGKVLLMPEGARDPQQPRPAPAGSRADPAAAPPAPPAQPAQSPPLPPVPQRPVTATLSPEMATGVRPPARESAPAEPPARPAAAREEQAGAGAPRGAPMAAPAAPRPAPQAPPRRGEGGRPGQDNQEQRQPGGQQWPIQPMAGEPPLTLFRGKELRELPAGSELDRFGGPNGNLTYAAGTPFEERSLVPEWVSRPYHVYRVQRPLEALAGVAIPWFNQPGGGAAYLLPASIEELLAEGDLIELEPGEPPID